METITLTKRIIDGKTVYNKRFDDYDKGLFGKRISAKEYNTSLADHSKDILPMQHLKSPEIIERVTYEN